MTRRSAQRIFNIACQDPRMMRVTPAARGLWMMLMHLWADLPEPGVFAIAGKPGKTQEISWQVRMPETEVETCLENLKNLGFATQRDDGAWVLVDLVDLVGMADAAVSASAQNGKKGGRPRKNETAAQAHARRNGGIQQRILPLVSVIEGEKPGNLEKPKLETQPHARVASSDLISKTDTKAKLAAAPETQSITRLGQQVADIAGLDPAKGFYTFQPVEAWLAAGATEGLILATITAVASRANYRAPGSLGYFTKAINDALERAKAQETKNSSAPSAVDPEWSAYFASYRKWTEGGCWGPEPIKPASIGERAA